MTVDLNEMAARVHAENSRWWHDLETGERLDRNKGQMLMLVVSELSEALEGERKNLRDDHLPHRHMAEVELADALIRLFDFAGGFGYKLQPTTKLLWKSDRAECLMMITCAVARVYWATFEANRHVERELSDLIAMIYAYAKKFGYDVDGAVEEKLVYNRTRADHTREARLATNGKKF